MRCWLSSSVASCANCPRSNDTESVSRAAETAALAYFHAAAAPPGSAMTPTRSSGLSRRTKDANAVQQTNTATQPFANASEKLSPDK